MADQTHTDQTRLPGLDLHDADYNKLVQFRRIGVDPPTGFYVTVDDVLVLTIANPSQTVTVNLSVRLLSPEGRLIPFWFSFPNVTAAGAPTSRLVRICEGFILSATVETPGATAGSAYVMLSVRRGTGSADQTQGDLLLADYPGSFGQVGYPVSEPVTPSEGMGLQRVATVSNPAAGADWSTTVPAGAQWVLQSVSAQLVTSVTAATRIPSLVIVDNAAHTLFTGVAALSQAASLTFSYSWSPGAIAPPTGSTANTGPLPSGMRLQAGWIIKTVTAAIQAGDQWSAIVLGVQELAAA